MRDIAILFIILPLLSLAQSATFVRDGEDQEARQSAAGEPEAALLLSGDGHQQEATKSAVAEPEAALLLSSNGEHHLDSPGAEPFS